MFEKQKAAGESTPLDIIPEEDSSFQWYMKAYTRLGKSRDMNGNIPLSEILSFTDYFILIGSLEEFIDVIYIIDEVVQSDIKRKSDAKKQQNANKNKLLNLKQKNKR